MYSNASGQTVLAYIDAEGRGSELLFSSDLATITFEDAIPARAVSSWKGKNVYEGDFWSATLGRHMHHESFLEREYLMAADFDRDIISFQSQPFVLKWPRGTPKQKSHVPDFFARRSGGSGRVVDVKRLDKAGISSEQFEMTQAVCSEVGWEYEIITGIPEPRMSNITFPCGFRQDRYSPSLQLTRELLGVFESSPSLETGVQHAAHTLKIPISIVHGYVLHLLWRHLLVTDLNISLHLSSIVSVPKE